MTASSTPERRTRPDLVARSLEVLRDSQAPTGAYLAAPAFPQYGHCWLRDGAFIAHAMDLCGDHASAAAFHRWAARTICRYRHKVEALEERTGAGARRDGAGVGDAEILHTRFTAGGGELAEDWGNFQLDGYGFWLASLTRHVEATSEGLASYAEAADLVLRYLRLLWDRPCYDCWEEYPAQRHGSTWAAVAAGLHAAGTLLGSPADVGLGERILARLRHQSARDGVLGKFAIDPAFDRSPDGDGQAGPARAVAGHERAGKPLPPGAVDGSALLVMGALGPFAPGDPLVAGTVAAIEQRLVAEGGGVHRYEHDEYYGGGLWVLLAGALADVTRRLGDPERAREVLDWVEAQADPDGLLPEQVSRHLRHPELLQPWRDRWGAPAHPLVWSHAMYVIARTDSAAAPRSAKEPA